MKAPFVPALPVIPRSAEPAVKDDVCELLPDEGSDGVPDTEPVSAIEPFALETEVTLSVNVAVAPFASDDPVQTDASITRLMTPDYASPEQVAGKLVTTATDVYSLGLLLFELLTGRRPFETILRTIDSEPPRASSISGLRALRGDLDRILLVALDPDPNRRYASVDRFADDVRRHLDGHPVSARGASLGYRTAKFVRRNKLFVAAAAVTVIVAIVAFLAVLQQKRIAERRFEQVRSLAHAVVFDLHDAIAKLPGSTSARALLVRHALGYLDALASESARNTPLQMELAAAYERVGDVQGMPYRANLGDSAGALASYRKALDIAEERCERTSRKTPPRCCSSPTCKTAPDGSSSARSASAMRSHITRPHEKFASRCTAISRSRGRGLRSPTHDTNRSIPLPPSAARTKPRSRFSIALPSPPRIARTS
jgi:hypothetical protein